MADTVWNARNAEHLGTFRRDVLAPLIVATRPLDLRTPEAVNDAARAWILCLKDVSEPVLQAGVERLMAEGPTWMPRPGDLRRACAEVIAEQRKVAGVKARELMADCVQCDGSGWERITVAGVEYVHTCGCKTRALSLLDGLPLPLELPPAPDDATQVPV